MIKKIIFFCRIVMREIETFLGKSRKVVLFFYRNAGVISQRLKKFGIIHTYNFIWANILVRELEIGFLDSWFRFFPKLAPYPRFIEVEITTRCNLKCIICERSYWDEEEREMAFEQFKGIIRQFPRLKWIDLTGAGSIFLHKDIIKILELLHRRGIFISFTDTFLCLNEDILRKIVELGVGRIFVSMDGATKETYEAIKRNSDFEKVVRNIRKLTELKKTARVSYPQLCFRYIVIKDNVSEIPDFIKLVHDLDPSTAKIEFAGLLSFKEIERLNAEVPEEIAEEAYRIADDLGIHIHFAHCLKKMPITQCAAWSEPYIMVDGSVITCCALLISNRRDFLRKASYGNIFVTPFRQIWRSGRYKRIRSAIPKSKGSLPLLCHNCRVFDTLGREKEAKSEDEQGLS